MRRNLRDAPENVGKKQREKRTRYDPERFRKLLGALSADLDRKAP
jgi:hypothetical protein